MLSAVPLSRRLGSPPKSLARAGARNPARALTRGVPAHARTLAQTPASTHTHNTHSRSAAGPLRAGRRGHGPARRGVSRPLRGARHPHRVLAQTHGPAPCAGAGSESASAARRSVQIVKNAAAAPIAVRGKGLRLRAVRRGCPCRCGSRGTPLRPVGGVSGPPSRRLRASRVARGGRPRLAFWPLGSASRSGVVALSVALSLPACILSPCPTRGCSWRPSPCAPSWCGPTSPSADFRPSGWTGDSGAVGTVGGSGGKGPREERLGRPRAAQRGDFFDRLDDLGA